MDIQNILNIVDHTLLRQDATVEEYMTLCDEALEFKTASVCVPPALVKSCREKLGGAIPVCTVIGFPNGYQTKESKCFEAADAVKNGADEIDMVINIGDLKDRKYDNILEEINAIKEAIGDKLLKVIVETCLLTEDEIIKIAEVVDRSNAEYIKTSTGFSTAGAKPRDIELFAANIKNETKIKAAGGISSIEDAERFISLGASRLGTSKIVKIAKSR